MSYTLFNKALPKTEKVIYQMGFNDLLFRKKMNDYKEKLDHLHNNLKNQDPVAKISVEENFKNKYFRSLEKRLKKFCLLMLVKKDTL